MAWSTTPGLHWDTVSKPVPHGIAVVDKPSGISSNGVVGRVRWALGTKKVGHAGTLDPMATGVLVFGVGKGTKLLTYLTGADKEYQATIRLGAATETDDAMGEHYRWATGTLPTDQDISAGIANLTGAIDQRPSTISAIKVDGKRAYARARNGEDITLAARPVTIHRFDLLDITPATVQGHDVLDVSVIVECSTGTYIRALARDLGDALGVGGHLTALRRTRVGPFTIDQACPAGDHIRLLGLGQVAQQLLPTEVLTASERLDLINGRLVDRPEQTPREPLAALDETGELVAIVRHTRRHIRPITVFQVAPTQRLS